ncbi:fibronectin type III domain-containing protein [Arthrobacter sp. IK3]|uniref:fibronectin type III domain-containing protein n=1 Tax=Arthrobacter sp. IK3 TaxID=3448169 RepID=UPI003EE0EC35
MRRSPLPELRKSSGAFDLPSIMTGVITVGILTAGILAAIFGVIPYAQNNAAKQDLSAIRTAEGVARTKDNRFMDHQGLLDTGYLQMSSTKQTKVKADEKGTCYVALAKSGTGKIFYSTDTRTDPEIFEADTETGCLTAEDLAELIEDVGGLDPAKGAPANLKLTAVSPLQAKATWESVKGSHGYKVEYRVGDGDWAVKHERIAKLSATVSALPEETIYVRVSAVKGDQISDPSIASLTLPDSALKNPSFEEGWVAWARHYTSGEIVSGKARTGDLSLKISKPSGASQVVTVPADTPVLSFWSTKPLIIEMGGKTIPSAVTDKEGDWVQYRADVSSLTGTLVTLRLSAAEYATTYVDDITLGGAVEADAPASLAVTSKLGGATATWELPAFTGGTPITEFTVTASLDGEVKAKATVDGGQRTATVEGLTVGKSYTFTITATNTSGESVASEPYGPVEINAGHISNPGFEQDSQGWKVRGPASASTVNSHSGAKGMSMKYDAGTGTQIEQSIAIPESATVLTYWSTPGSMKVTFNKGVRTPVIMAQGENGWAQYKLDVSDLAGTTATLGMQMNQYTALFYLDDFALVGATVPDAPTAVAASSRLGAATVTWTAPVFAGGTPVGSYTATAWVSGKAVSRVNVGPNLRSATFNDLKLGSEYTFTVSARNARGESIRSDSTPALEISSGHLANPGFEQGLEGWTLLNNGSSSTEEARSGAQSFYSSNSSYGPGRVTQAVIIPADRPLFTYWSTGPAQAYFAGNKRPSYALKQDGVWTQYAVDFSANAGELRSVGVAGVQGVVYFDDIELRAPIVPGAPTAVSASSKDSKATVTWAAPEFHGGSPVTSYKVTAWSGGVERGSTTTTALTATLNGLTAGASYTFTVQAVNIAGASAKSDAFGPLEVWAGVFANASFEHGMAGWQKSGDSVSFTNDARTGVYSLRGGGRLGGIRQSVNVPVTANAITFWAKGTPSVNSGGYTGSAMTAVAGETVDGWTKYSINITSARGTTAAYWFGGATVNYDDVGIE